MPPIGIVLEHLQPHCSEYLSKNKHVPVCQYLTHYNFEALSGKLVLRRHWNTQQLQAVDSLLGCLHVVVDYSMFLQNHSVDIAALHTEKSQLYWSAPLSLVDTLGTPQKVLRGIFHIQYK